MLVTCYTPSQGTNCEITRLSNSCQDAGCSGNGRCELVSAAGSFSCICDPGHAGDRCEVRVDGVTEPAPVITSSNTQSNSSERGAGVQGK